MSNEFEEISHLGGKVTFTIVTEEDGRQSYQAGYRITGNAQVKIIAIYALPPGEPVGLVLQLGGTG